MAQQRKLNELKRGPIRHQELPPAVVSRIDSLRATLDAVYPQSMAQWLDGFQRDANPELEILWWERLAQCYVEYSRSQELNGEQKRVAFDIIFKLLLGSSSGDVAPDLANLPPNALYDILEILDRICKKH